MSGGRLIAPPVRTTQDIGSRIPKKTGLVQLSPCRSMLTAAEIAENSPSDIYCTAEISCIVVLMLEATGTLRAN
jgi:hypothetical protein